MRGVFILFALGAVCSSASAADICNDQAHQFGTVRHCVTTARDTAFGPQNLTGMGDGAWCAAADAKAPFVITLTEAPKALIRTLYITNGVGKSEELFRQNGRARRVTFETDRGYKGTLTLKDIRTSQRIIIEKGRLGWLRLTILDTYPGTANASPCLSEFLINIEEFAAR
jgi:hypothetical protein